MPHWHLCLLCRRHIGTFLAPLLLLISVDVESHLIFLPGLLPLALTDVAIIAICLGISPATALGTHSVHYVLDSATLSPSAPIVTTFQDTTNAISQRYVFFELQRGASIMGWLEGHPRTFTVFPLVSNQPLICSSLGGVEVHVLIDIG